MIKRPQRKIVRKKAAGKKTAKKKATRRKVVGQKVAKAVSPKNKATGKPPAKKKKTKQKVPKYVEPSRRKFRVDVEIGRFLLETPDALSKAEIMRDFDLSMTQFVKRAKYLARVIDARERKELQDLLKTMGKTGRRVE